MPQLLHLLPLYISLLSLPTVRHCSAQTCRNRYSPINGSLCIRPEFTRTIPEVSSEQPCAFLCSREPSCQAFTTAAGPCQLFVFDRCSKSVRNCSSCSLRGRLLVKQQSGLPPGSLCPSDFGDDRCGVKYRLYSELGYWAAQKQRCEFGGGLAMMADAVDLAEMDYINQLYTKYSLNLNLFLDGYQPAGSAEPRGGWVWSTCGITVNESLWYGHEPDNNGGNEEALARGSSTGRLHDVRQNTDRGVVCECVSPFD